MNTVLLGQKKLTVGDVQLNILLYRGYIVPRGRVYIFTALGRKALENKALKIDG